MQASHRVAMNTGILYARMGITVFISLYTTRVILNALGVGDFGIFNIVGGAIAMLTFLNSSMAAATQRFMSYAQGEGDAQKQRSIFNVSVVLHAVIAVVVLALLEGVGWVLFHSVFKIAPERMHAAWMVYQFAAVSTIFTIVSVPYDAVINAHENMLLFAILGVIESVLKLIIALFIVQQAGDKLVFYGFWMAGIAIFLMLLRLLYCHTRYTECVIAPWSYFRKPLFKEMTSFAGWSLMGSSSSMIAKYAQGTVINKFFGTTVNAAYGISDQVSGQLGAFASTMLRALNPMVAKSEGAGNRELMLKATAAGTKISFSLLMLFYVPVFIEMPYIFNIWLKHPPEYAVLFCRLLLVRNLVEQLYIPLWGAITAVGDIRNFQITFSILSFVPLVVTYFLYSKGFAPHSLFVVFLCYSICMLGVMLWYGRKLCSINVLWFLRTVIIPCCTSYVLCTTVALLPWLHFQTGLLRLALVSAFSSVSFFASVWLIVLNRDERTNATHLVNRIKSKIIGSLT